MRGLRLQHANALLVARKVYHQRLMLLTEKKRWVQQRILRLLLTRTFLAVHCDYIPLWSMGGGERGVPSRVQPDLI